VGQSEDRRRSVKGVVLAVALWAVPLGAAGQTGKPPAEAEAHQQTITVKPAANGCAVALSTKVGKALGTPEGLNSATQGEKGREPIGSIIACQCGTTVESKECVHGGSCTCGPGETPAVVCN
jgi:hypothetical protein